jgi:hypothetical protein
MKNFLHKRTAECRDFEVQFEDTVVTAPSTSALPELLAALPTHLKEHAATCADCHASAENILLTRSWLSVLPSNAAVPGPWFAPRVMAAIAARKEELGRAADTWTFLPKLAARLTWASAVALLLASTWLYQRPASSPTSTSAKAVATDITGEPVVENVTPASNDEVLVSLAERPR